jgi:hypothetical protein
LDRLIEYPTNVGGTWPTIGDLVGQWEKAVEEREDEVVKASEED